MLDSQMMANANYREAFAKENWACRLEKTPLGLKGVQPDSTPPMSVKNEPNAVPNSHSSSSYDMHDLCRAGKTSAGQESSSE